MDDNTVLHSLYLVEEKLDQVIDDLGIFNTRLTEFENKLDDIIEQKNGHDRSSFAKRKVRQWLENTKK